MNYKHRVIAELKPGLPLPPDEVVYHDDKNRRDNHLANIWVFSSQRGHMIFHNYLWQQKWGKVHLFTVDEVLSAKGESWLV